MPNKKEREKSLPTYEKKTKVLVFGAGVFDRIEHGIAQQFVSLAIQKTFTINIAREKVLQSQEIMLSTEGREVQT